MLPRIAEAVCRLAAESALIDGEAVVFRPDGHSDFAAVRTKADLARACLVASRARSASIVGNVEVALDGRDFPDQPVAAAGGPRVSGPAEGKRPPGGRREGCVQTTFSRDGSKTREAAKVMRPARRKNHELAASSLRVLGLLVVQASEANAVVCAAGAYHAVAPQRAAPRSCGRWLGPTARRSFGQPTASTGAFASTAEARLALRNVQTASNLEARDKSEDKPTRLFMADTSVNEILDGMDIRFGTSPLPVVNGDSIAVQSEKGDFFHFLVQRPEGRFGAVVSCNVPPLFWTSTSSMSNG
jgi:hypothetical protein